MDYKILLAIIIGAVLVIYLINLGTEKILVLINKNNFGISKTYGRIKRIFK